MRCRVCDNELTEDALFCDQCGSRVRGWHATATPPPTPTRDADSAESLDKTDATEALVEESGQGEQDQRSDLDDQDDSVQQNDGDNPKEAPRETDADHGPDNVDFEGNEPSDKTVEPDSSDERDAEQEGPDSKDADEDEPESVGPWASEPDSEHSNDPDIDNNSKTDILETDDPFEPDSSEFATVPSFRIPSCASMVVPPSPPEEPKLGRNTIISIGAIALAVAILILIGIWITVRAMFA